MDLVGLRDIFGDSFIASCVRSWLAKGALNSRFSVNAFSKIWFLNTRKFVQGDVIHLIRQVDFNATFKVMLRKVPITFRNSGCQDLVNAEYQLFRTILPLKHILTCNRVPTNSTRKKKLSYRKSPLPTFIDTYVGNPSVPIIVHCLVSSQIA